MLTFSSFSFCFCRCGGGFCWGGRGIRAAVFSVCTVVESCYVSLCHFVARLRSLLVQYVTCADPKGPHARELRSRVKVEVAVLGSPSLTVLMVSVDVKTRQH